MNYHQLYARFPEGGGDAAAASAAFGEGWAFLPLGSLITDYALTISISVAAGASAIIAYVPELAPGRIELALGLLCFVAGLTWFGHGGRLVFATMTIAFVVVALVVVAHGFHFPRRARFRQARADRRPSRRAAQRAARLPGRDGAGHRSRGALLGDRPTRPAGRQRATPFWPHHALADARDRRDPDPRPVGARRLPADRDPPADSTTIAEVARAATGEGALFAAFQVTTAVLLLAAASSSFQAGPGLLKALARGGVGVGVLPDWLGRTNRHHTPYWGVVVFLAVSAVIVVGAAGREQRLVLFYAVAVFIAFLCGLLAMARLFRAEGKRLLLLTSLLGATAVAVTLAVNLARGYPVISLIAALVLAGVLHALWVRAGRPRGIAGAERFAGEALDPTE